MVIDSKLLEAWLSSVANPEGNSVNAAHLLFYNLGDEAARQEYYRVFLNDPVLKQYVEEPYFPPEYDFVSLGTLPEGTLGYTYYHHITDNRLNVLELKDYPAYQASLEEFKGMPEELKYATFRSFQVHDLTHIMAGYGIDHYGELAVQAFSLAQFKRPYPMLLISVATTHAAFLKPQRIEEYMDALVDGWTKGKRAKSLIGVRWEELFDRQLLDLQREYGLI
jgi:ubiquinone biosynthesis protein Coq4